MQNANTVVALTVHTAFVPSAGFKVQSANHYTIRPRLSASMVCTGSSAQHCPSTPASPPAAKNAKTCAVLAWIWTTSWVA